MLRKVQLLSVLALVLFVALGGIASASDPVYVDGVWSTVNPGGASPGATCDAWATGPGDNPTAISEDDPGIQSPPTDDENQVRYGGFDACALFGGRSGFGFDGVDVSTAPINEPFFLGTFTHYNRSTGSLDPFEFADLTITLPFSCTAEGDTDPSVVYRFTLDETTNAAPCPYPGEKECTDKVTFSSPGDVAFTCNGNEYDLQILGFITGERCDETYSGEPLSQFITEEDTNNSACLWAQINGEVAPPTPVPPTPVPPAPIPEPGSIMLVAGAVAAAGAYLRMRRKA